MKQYPPSTSCSEQITILLLWHPETHGVFGAKQKPLLLSRVSNLSEQRKDSMPGEQKDEEIKLLPWGYTLSIWQNLKQYSLV